MKLHGENNLETFSLEFEENIRKVNACGVEWTNQESICCLLLAMPKSLETVTTILESMPSKELTVDIAKTRLRSEVERNRSKKYK
ncbi:unnamed protein product [Pieris macdunnoughi]|nr:unnamed protein product [Pieris macdunnoughi]